MCPSEMTTMWSLIKKYHGTTMVYHGKQWYIVVNSGNHGKQWYNHGTLYPYHGTSLYHHGTIILHHGMLWCTMVQPCVTMVYPWYK